MAAPLEQIVGGKYEILEKLREGGMGSIYKVRHRLLEQVRVIKVLHPQLALDEKLRQRFQNEAKVAIRLRHPNIAQLYDFSVDESGVAYIVMEYIDGVTLHELIEASGPPSLGLAVDIGAQCLKALGYLHREGFVHRDIASDNLMLTRDFKDEPLVKLIDLGIAKGLDSTGLTATGMFMGKGRYAAPEQFSKGAAELDQRSDLYSFGVLFYELLTGHSPVSGDDFSEVVAGHLFRPPLAFEESDPGGKVPAGLRSLVLHALEKDPDQRIPTAAAFAKGLSDYRDPAPSRKAEFSEAFKTTTSVNLSDLRPSKPGSTQERLDRHFQLVDQGEGAEPAELPGLTIVGDSVEPAPPGKTDPAGGAPRPSGGPRRRLIWAGAAAAGLAAVAVAVWLMWPGRATPETELSAPSAEALEVARVEPWSRTLPPSEDGVDASAATVPEPPFAPRETRPEIAQRPPPPRPDSRAVPPLEGRPPPGSVPPPLGGPPPGPAGRPGPGEQAQLTPPSHPGELYTLGPGVTPPQPVEIPEPVLPEGTEAPKDPFEVVVSVLVNEEGRAITSRIVEAPMFKRRYRDAATEAAMAATFRPPLKAGVPGKMWFDLTFRFGAG